MNDWRELLRSQRSALIEATAAHMDLVGEAIALAVLIGVPLGILASRSKPAERSILGLANVLQTIPSMALLGVLLILFRGKIGKDPALAALVIYSLLPIIKNTILGLKSVDRGVAEAALGMGMTPWQRLTLVELPLATPVLLGGVRVAAVAAVGMATIAAAIGAKGLGTFIFRGISLSDPRLILLGSIPAAILALASDAALGELEDQLEPTRARRSRWRNALALSATAALVSLGLYGAWIEAGSGTRSNTVVIGSKDGAEMNILGEMMAQLIEKQTTLKVDRRLNLGGSLICYNALDQGGLDAYVEYTGTALTTILKQPPDNNPAVVFDTVKVMLDRERITTFPPLGFENTFAILMRRKQAEALGIKKISDLIRHQKTLRAGFGPEFMNRPDGYPGLIISYGLNFTISPREMDRNLLYQAVAGESIDVAAGDSTDGRISTLDLVQLEDDRRYFPPYEAVMLARSETLNKFPEVKAALEKLSGKIDAPTMQKLNHQVDGLKRDPAEVAKEFLESAGLLKVGK
jgi:osmoprotectant transport system permease protein